VRAQRCGFLIAIEMATAMIYYIPLVHLADEYGQRARGRIANKHI